MYKGFNLQYALITYGYIYICTLLYLNSNYTEAFQFDIKGKEWDCLYEQMDSRTSSNKMLVRFSLVEPDHKDYLDIEILSPSKRIIQSWNATKAEHLSLSVRENGLFSFCFRKTKGSSKLLTVLYILDFISTGSRTLTAYPLKSGTLTEGSSELNSDVMEIKGKKSFGFVNFDLHDVSPSILHENTRVLVLLSTEYSSKESREIRLSEIPLEKFENSMGYDSLYEYRSHDIDYTEASTGKSIFFDVTDVVEECLKAKRDKIGFGVYDTADSSSTEYVRLFSINHGVSDEWPALVFEDIGVDTMTELALFKENLFDLRGEVSFLIQKERLSRNVVESTNSRVTFSSLLVNVVLIAVAATQVLYVQHLLKTSY